MARMMSQSEETRAMGHAAKKRFLENYSKEISVRRMKEIVDGCIEHEL
jgi:hypothetical protein